MRIKGILKMDTKIKKNEINKTSNEIQSSCLIKNFTSFSEFSFAKLSFKEETLVSNFIIVAFSSPSLLFNAASVNYTKDH